MDNILHIVLSVRKEIKAFCPRCFNIERDSACQGEGILNRGIRGPGDNLQVYVTPKIVLVSQKTGSAIDPVHGVIRGTHYTGTQE